MPLFRDLADIAQQAIRTFDAGRERVRATTYTRDMGIMRKDADEAAKILQHSLKIEKIRGKEMRLERSLGEASGI